MRRFFALIIILISSATGFCQEAEFSIDKPVHKFPKTYQGQKLEHFYAITNTGKVPLIISDYKVACTCTKAFLPEKPILPGETFQLKVTFDTNGKYDFQDRLVKLKTNSKNGIEELRFKVKVVPRNE